MPTLAYNKRANYDYEITETYEAGLVLSGQEVKSIKSGHISMKGSFVTVKATDKELPDLYLVNSFVPPYKFASKLADYDPYHSRKLLLHKNQIRHLLGKKAEQGLTLVPIKIYTKKSLIKLEFGVGKGKKEIDKRETIKRRDVDRNIRTILKNKRA